VTLGIKPIQTYYLELYGNQLFTIILSFLGGIEMHLFNGLYCYLMCFRIVLLMKHWKNIFIK